MADGMHPTLRNRLRDQRGPALDTRRAQMDLGCQAFAMASQGLTHVQLAELRAALETKRDHLRASLATHGRPIVETNERPIEDVDLAEREIERNDAAAVGEHEHQLLDAVEAALAAMDGGSYGISEVSGEPIPFARLRAVPWARRNSDE
jgi:DnaK suppressor protein